jgi:hypothetical protein
MWKKKKMKKKTQLVEVEVEVEGRKAALRPALSVSNSPYYCTVEAKY